MESQTTVIEINGVKLEVDLRHAKRIDHLTIGSRVKCLVKRYDSWSTRPGVVVGFEPFKNRPSIVVCYLETDYSSADLKFVSYNADTKGFEIVADLDQNALEVDRAGVIKKMDSAISKKREELEELEAQREFFQLRFGQHFSDMPKGD